MNRITLLEQALHQADDAILITDAGLDSPGPRILYVNPAFCKMTGYPESELLGRCPRLLQGPATDRAVLDKLRRCLSAGQVFHGRTVNYRKNGEPFEVEWRVSPLADASGRVNHFLSVHRDVTARTRFEQQIENYILRLSEESMLSEARRQELEEINARLEALATTDGLTGLSNHRAFQSALRDNLGSAGTVSLVLLDVDRFKAYNDTFGHPAGDAALQAVAAALRASIRPGDLAARYGGEEFALLLPGLEEAQALSVAERVRAAVEAASGPLRTITVSAGVATGRGGEVSPSALVEQADTALYAAKAHGRNRVRHTRQLHRVETARPGPEKARCAPSPSGCLRCQSVPEGRCQSKAALVLGPQDEDVDATLRRALTGASLAFAEVGPTLVIADARPRLNEIGVALKHGLTPYTRSRVRAAYAPGGAEDETAALRAMLSAEPLSEIAEQLEYEWARDALAGGWLFSEFHPILDARTGEVFAQEALLRARDPETGRLIGAGPLLVACNALRLEHQLDQQARRSAIRGASEHVPAPAKVFINFLPNTIYDPEICLRTTMEAAAESEVPLSRLVFEVVETEKIPDMGRLHHILDYYRSRGVGTAVDDMGAGYTSVEYLTALRPDYVKLDRDLVREAEEGGDARKRMGLIIGAARDLGIQVIAEGIETEAQMALCLEAGANYFQGYLFARPAVPPQPVRFPRHVVQAAL